MMFNDSPDFDDENSVPFTGSKGIVGAIVDIAEEEGRRQIRKGLLNGVCDLAGEACTFLGSFVSGDDE